jgi:HEAT repeat protein
MKEETLMRIRLALTLALRDPATGVQVQAARALERIEGVFALQHLAVTADSPDTAGALRSLYAVADIGGEKAFAILCNAVKAPSAEVRAAAVKLLARTKDSRVANHFIEALEDPNPDVKVLILEALGDFREPRLLEILLPQLQQGSDPIREAAITALGNLGDLRAVDALLPLVNDGTPSIRERVAEALGRLGVRAAEEERLEEITPPA